MVGCPPCLSHQSIATAAFSWFAAERPAGRRQLRARALCQLLIDISCRCPHSVANVGGIMLRASRTRLNIDLFYSQHRWTLLKLHYSCLLQIACPPNTYFIVYHLHKICFFSFPTSVSWRCVLLIVLFMSLYVPPLICLYSYTMWKPWNKWLPDAVYFDKQCAECVPLSIRIP